MDKSLHIISFDVPFPADYGGVIDVFYKLRYLKEQGVKIHLHCFQYGRSKSEELNKYCETVNYYSRNTNISKLFSKIPYIIKSRDNEKLKRNLLENDFPILVEGLHGMAVLLDKRFDGRQIYYRESNVEHHYYTHLADAEQNWLKKMFFITESFKLKAFEKYIHQVSGIFTVSESDNQYYKSHFQNIPCYHIPSFHDNDVVKSALGKGDYALYHGNLSVSENYRAARYLIEMFANTEIKLIIAGKQPPTFLQKEISLYENIILIEDPQEAEMVSLIRNAGVNVLHTFQPTGLKLKLLNVLFIGRHCVVNSHMIQGTGLESICVIVNDPNDLKAKVEELLLKEFTQEDILERENALTNYSNKRNAEKLVKIIFRD